PARAGVGPCPASARLPLFAAVSSPFPPVRVYGRAGPQLRSTVGRPAPDHPAPSTFLLVGVPRYIQMNITNGKRRARTSMSADKTKLLFAPSPPPVVQVGDLTLCLYRDAEVVVYGWSMAPVPWPRCYQAGKHGAGKGILVDDELARAIRHESALAVQYWWGVCQKTVCKWRAALGIFRTDAGGRRRLILQSAVNGLNARRRGAAGEVRLVTAAELDLLGTLPDAEVGFRTDRTYHAVRTMRRHRRLPAV